jgi:hypothetical protein
MFLESLNSTKFKEKFYTMNLFDKFYFASKFGYLVN